MGTPWVFTRVADALDHGGMGPRYLGWEYGGVRARRRARAADEQIMISAHASTRRATVTKEQMNDEYTLINNIGLRQAFAAGALSQLSSRYRTPGRPAGETPGRVGKQDMHSHTTDVLHRAAAHITLGRRAASTAPRKRTTARRQ
ncbi:hypothetical protein EVG20_g11583, partial [Dentipellis fragilis]